MRNDEKKDMSMEEILSSIRRYVSGGDEDSYKHDYQISQEKSVKESNREYIPIKNDHYTQEKPMNDLVRKTIMESADKTIVTPRDFTKDSTERDLFPRNNIRETIIDPIKNQTINQTKEQREQQIREQQSREQQVREQSREQTREQTRDYNSFKKDPEINNTFFMHNTDSNINERYIDTNQIDLQRRQQMENIYPIDSKKKDLPQQENLSSVNGNKNFDNVTEIHPEVVNRFFQTFEKLEKILEEERKHKEDKLHSGLEDFIKKSLVRSINEWLNQNLAQVVEKVIEGEIKKLRGVSKNQPDEDFL